LSATFNVFIATIADGRWRKVSRHQAAIQASIESAQPRLSACIRHGDKAASRLAPKGDDGRFDLYVAANGRSDWLDLE